LRLSESTLNGDRSKLTPNDELLCTNEINENFDEKRIENDLSLFEQVIMKAHFFIKNFIPGEDKWFGLEASAVKIEKVPLVIQPVESVHLKRRY
jgi:hypothetical protein